MEFTFDIFEMAQLFIRQLGLFASSVFEFFNTPVVIFNSRYFNLILGAIEEIFPSSFNLSLQIEQAKIAMPIWSLVIGAMILLPLVINLVKWVLQLIDFINPLG